MWSRSNGLKRLQNVSQYPYVLSIEVLYPLESLKKGDIRLCYEI